MTFIRAGRSRHKEVLGGTLGCSVEYGL
ncbi:uncharacterized protein FTOL_01454 [Fusarium torulosum]|uniref:Uncharacterized protein n=1 Tax=Fusarium torulosum TaxID=33205 RepID=A0AAE8M006_9HYPO|nr:uncharacterized protein FTOL_01454 [Fusarium torulosum]